VPALKGVSEAELYAVCTAHADTAQAAADKFGVTRAYGSDKALGADRSSSGGRGAPAGAL
jgi:predicted dehydrogenase